MIQIPAVTERCAGIDVGKRGLAVARAVGPVDKEAAIETRWFGTTVPALRELDAWLREAGCTAVAMESTGSYWIPVKNILEGSVKITLVSPRKHHPKKGQKTDFRDAVDLAVKHRHGLLTGSFTPERGIVELRDFTRRRKKLCGVLASEKNRIQKVLETANVKFGNVASDVFGVSGQNILKALLDDKPMTAEELAQMARGKLRQKIPQLTEALEQHQLNDHHRWLIRHSVEHAQFLERQIEELEVQIQQHLEPYRKQYELLLTIPGVKEASAATILAEIGADMTAFPSGDDLSSWAGICPGNNRSAGKSKSSHIKRANKFLTAALVEAGWGAVRKRGGAFGTKFRRWVKGIGKKKANVAIAHNLLRVIYSMLKTGEPYREADASVMQARQREYQVQYYGRLLVQLGADPKAVMGLVDNTIGGQVLREHSSEAVCAEPAGTTEDVQTVADVAHPSEHVVEPGPTPVQQTSDSVVQSDVREPKAKSAGSGPERRRQRIAHGVLGFRIRANENSTVKNQSGTPPSPARPTVKSTAKRPKKTNHPSSRSHPSKPG